MAEHRDSIRNISGVPYGKGRRGTLVRFLKMPGPKLESLADLGPGNTCVHFHHNECFVWESWFTMERSTMLAHDLLNICRKSGMMVVVDTAALL